MKIERDMDFFHLSRIGASAERNGLRMLARIARPDGPGVRVQCQSEGEALTFWVPQADWCGWVAPELTLGSFDDVSDEFRMLLVSYSFAPLQAFLEAQGLPGLSLVAAEAAVAPLGENWLITMRYEARCLPLFLTDTPTAWRRALLETFTPSDDDAQNLPLSAGWCMRPSSDRSDLRVGDALPIHGMAEDLDSLWLGTAGSEKRINLLGDNRGRTDKASSLSVATPCGPLMRVEVGRARMVATALASWDAGEEGALHVDLLTVAQLTDESGVVAYGDLLRFDTGWAFKISLID